MSTGNEVVDIRQAESLSDGSIRDTNRPSLKYALESRGFQVVDLGIASDSIDGIEKSLRQGIQQADVILTTGGVSMGELDLLKPIIERNLKGTIHFGRVALKPGKPTTFATVPCAESSDDPSEKLIFALPGNPVSALVTFQLFVIPSLLSLSGVLYPNHRLLKVKVSFTFRLCCIINNLYSCHMTYNWMQDLNFIELHLLVNQVNRIGWLQGQETSYLVVC